MTQENVARVERETEAPITVVIGNPPYNAWQLNENDNNKNRKYEIIDRRVSETYAKDSTASNKNALSDMYVKFFRWAVDRLNGRDGIVCFVTNNSFVDQIAFDGMRKHLLQDFTRVYHVHLEGNVRHNPKLAGTTYNVFGIQVGVGITVAVRCQRHRGRRLLFHRVDKTLRREQKLAWLAQHGDVAGVKWQRLEARRAAHLACAGERRTSLPSSSRLAARRSSGGRGRTRRRSLPRTPAGREDQPRRRGVRLSARRAWSSASRSSLKTYNGEVDRYNALGGKVEPRRFRPVRQDQVERDAEERPAARQRTRSSRAQKFATSPVPALLQAIPLLRPSS